MARIAAIADSASAPDPAFASGLRSALAAGLDYGLAAIAAPQRDPDPVPIEILAQARLAARNGVSLDATLRCHSAGHSLLADGLLEEAAAVDLGAAELRSALRALALRYDRIVAAAGEEHEREALVLQGAASRRHILLRRLLAGEPLDTTALKYPFEVNHLALIVAGEDAAPLLARLGEFFDRRLLLAEPDAQLAWAWLGGRRPFAESEIDRIASYPWPEGCAVACGEPGGGIAGWRLSHRQAAAALAVAQRGSDRIVHYAEVTLLASALQDDLLLASLRRRYLVPLESERDGGAAAKKTLRAYFAASGNVSSAAAALRISRSTMRSRLASVEERLGRPLEAIATPLQLALDLERLEGSTEPERCRAPRGAGEKMGAPAIRRSPVRIGVA
jgi:hypothetical protein